MLTRFLGSVSSGNVRALIALYLVGVTGYLFASGIPVQNELLVLTTFIVKDYFHAREDEERAKAANPEPAPPFILGGGN